MLKPAPSASQIYALPAGFRLFRHPRRRPSLHFFMSKDAAGVGVGDSFSQSGEDRQFFADFLQDR
ncbi:MAG: hypothetical protein ACRC1K_23195 [Planctomycetia bacterium]